MQNNKIHRVGGTHNNNPRKRLKGTIQSKMGSLKSLGGKFQINFFFVTDIKKKGGKKSQLFRNYLPYQDQ